MDQQLVQDTGPDHQITPKLQTEPGPQTTLEQEPTSDPGVSRDQQIAPTPAGNEEALRQHQRNLRFTYPSLDLSEISYQTEYTAFPGSRHSSINTEPLTLDADQIHDAKDQAVDVIEKVDSQGAFDIFTEDLPNKGEDDLTQDTEANDIADQINTLVEKAQHVADANIQQQLKPVDKTPAAPSASTIEDRKGLENVAGFVDEDVKIKSD